MNKFLDASLIILTSLEIIMLIPFYAINWRHSPGVFILFIPLLFLFVISPIKLLISIINLFKKRLIFPSMFAIIISLLFTPVGLISFNNEFLDILGWPSDSTVLIILIAFSIAFYISIFKNRYVYK